MDIEQIKELVSILENSSLTELTLKTSEGQLRLKKEKKIITKVMRDAESSTENKPETNAVSIEPPDDAELYTSPMVGVFYTSPSETEEAYVKEGDILKKGQPLCVIEAMKMMQEIKSDFDMQILEVLVGNAEKIEYDQPLFKIKKI